MIKKEQQVPTATPIREAIINPQETSQIETFKGVANKAEILQETSLIMTYKEGADRERTPLGNTRGTHNKETIDPSMTITMIITEIIIENIHHGGTRAKTNPHGMYKTRETQEDNPQGETREVVTQ